MREPLAKTRLAIKHARFREQSSRWGRFAWIASTFPRPEPDLVGQLLNLSGLANDRHRKLILRCLIDLRLQSGRHLQQVGALVGNLPFLWIYRRAVRKLLCGL